MSNLGDLLKGIMSELDDFSDQWAEDMGNKFIYDPMVKLIEKQNKDQ